MSLVIRDCLSNKIKLYCKGADNVILERINEENNPYKNVTLQHLEECAKEGLRTLIIACKEVSEKDYQVKN